MKLLLHIGIHKTGSSVLQTLMTLNKNALISNGIFVPSSKWDEKMQNGLISPGNGHELAKLISSSKRNGVEQYFSKVLTDARLSKCQSVLLSNEVLVRLFSDVTKLNSVIVGAKSVGFNEIDLICFWREPISHAASLFKHRAKSKVFSSYKSWLKNNYETWRLAENFVNNLEDLSSVNVHHFLYRNESGYLKNKFFNEYLGIENLNEDVTKSINPSLGFNELAILHHYESIFPNISSFLFPKLIANSDEWLVNDELKKEFERNAVEVLKEYDVFFEKLANLLPAEDRALFLHKLSSSFKNDVVSTHTMIILNDAHLSIIRSVLNDYVKIKQSHRIIFFLKKVYNRARRLMIRNSFDTERFGGSLSI